MTDTDQKQTNKFTEYQKLLRENAIKLHKRRNEYLKRNEFFPPGGYIYINPYVLKIKTIQEMIEKLSVKMQLPPQLFHVEVDVTTDDLPDIQIPQIPAIWIQRFVKIDPNADKKDIQDMIIKYIDSYTIEALREYRDVLEARLTSYVEALDKDNKGN